MKILTKKKYNKMLEYQKGLVLQILEQQKENNKLKNESKNKIIKTQMYKNLELTINELKETNVNLGNELEVSALKIKDLQIEIKKLKKELKLKDNKKKEESNSGRIKTTNK